MTADPTHTPGTLPRTLAEYRNRHAGETIIVCGCGSSLGLLGEPGRYVTIGVNDVGRMFQPDYLVVVNSRGQFSGDRFRFVEESQARALFTHLELGIRHPNIVKFQLGQRSGTAFTNPHVLHYTRNSPYVAVCLAIHMGAKRIGLIGVDFTDDHFFAKTGRHPLERELPQIDAEYRKLHAAATSLGVELFNVSPQSRLTALPKIPLADLAPRRKIVSYATTPVAGVPAILGRAIAARTQHEGRCVWARSSYGNGVTFTGDVEYSNAPAVAKELLEAADAVVVHNGRVDSAHRAILATKRIVTLAHNYMWNVDAQFVKAGQPGLVVGQYQATLPEFAGWTPVPNPIPLWEPAHQPATKDDTITIAYTPSGKHDRYARDHRLYWHSKGYKTTMSVLERLAAKMPLRLEVIRDRQISHDEALAMKRRAHIVIDECVTGSYHRNSLEGLAAGAVVVNGVGILPEVADVFRRCASDAPDIPFVFATLESLESVLAELIARGPDALREEGAKNRLWMERWWDFGQQWSRYWEPAFRNVPKVEDRQSCLSGPPPPAGQAGLPVLHSDTTIVIPVGGIGRLRNLKAVLDRLKNSGAPLLVVESDTEPHAKEVADAAGARHLFVPADGAFHKARVMNAGAAAVETARICWYDSDLLVNDDFLAAAVSEMDLRKLDCLVPWTSVQYLSEGDSHEVAEGRKPANQCAKVNEYFTRRGAVGGIVLLRTEFFRRFGGMIEEFRGWGGEDNAFFHKASILGRAAITSRHDQHAWHLWHPLSGGYGPEHAINSNPNYQQNLALLKEVRTLTTPDRFLRRFPATAPAPAPVAAPRGGLRLNLGCCDDIRNGYTNVDCAAGPGVDTVVDLAKPWPWADGTVDEILAHDIIEHLPDKILTMNEAWRVLRAGGRFDIAVPTTDGTGAFQDPTHVSFWNRRSFLYYEKGNPYRERFAKSYGITAAFKVVSEHVDHSMDGPRLTIVLEAVK